MLPGYQLPNRTRLICRILKWSTVLIAAIFVYLYFANDTTDTLSDYFWNELSDEAQAAVVVSDGKTHAIRALATLAWFMPLTLLFGAWRMFAAFQTGDAFSLRTVKSIRFMGVVIIMETLFRILFPSAMIGLMTFNSAEGQRILRLSIGTDQSITLLFGTLFLIIGQIFTEAVQISDENRQIV